VKTVFLSYARDDDEAFVERLCADLIQRGFEVCGIASAASTPPGPARRCPVPAGC